MVVHPADPAALHLAAIVKSSDDAIISKDLTGRITSWNRAAEVMFGYPAAEAVGKSIRMIIPADRQGEEDDVLSRIVKGETVEHFDTIRVRKDGSFINISVTISPIRDVDGRIVGASKIARDVTEQKRAAAALALAQSQRQDLQQRLIALTEASQSLLGSPRVDEVLPATLSLASDLITADAYAVWRLDEAQGIWGISSYAGVSSEFAASRASIAATGMPRDFTRPVVAEDIATAEIASDRKAAHAREGIVSMLAVPLLIGGRGVASLVFYYRQRHAFSDVELQTARALGNLAAAAIQNAELYAARRRSEIEARFLARVGELLASSLDYHHSLSMVARAAVPEVADWCAIHLLQDGALALITVAHVDPSRQRLAEDFQREYPADASAPGTIENVVRTGKPSLVPYLSPEMIEAGARSAEHLDAVRRLRINSYMAVPLRTRSGIIGAMTFVSAESRRHFGEHDLRFAEAVAGRVALAVENAGAYEEARRANRLKDEFLATLSHELRTPLNAILGYTRMIRTGVIAKDRRDKALDTVERNASALAQIVDDVLDVSRIVSGKLGVQVRAMRLDALVDEAIATIMPAAQAKGVQVRAQVAADVGTITGDPDRLQQVLWNLLSNGVKFNSRGGRVDLQAARVGQHVELVVTDTGAGIAPTFLPFVFERFSQADSRLAGVRSGLGIGLSITRHIIEMHGGTIEASSDGLGRGATFRVRLPADPVETAPE